MHGMTTLQTLFRTLIVAGLFALLGTGACHANTAGAVVSIGGALRDDNHEVWGRVVQLAGGKGARFVVLATASDDPDRSAAAIIRLLEAQGAVAEHVRVAPRIEGMDLAAAVRQPRWIAMVAAANGVYFAGGDQSRLVDTLAPAGVRSPLLNAIWDLHRRGGVVAGSSAGAAVMSEVMFSGGEPLAVMKGSAGVVHRNGLGFIRSGVLVDQHFLKRGRIGRLLPTLMSQKMALGLGIEEDSAVVIRGDEVEVIGSRGALFVDMSDALVDPQLADFNVRSARLNFLAKGDRLNLATRVVSSARSQPMAMSATQAKAYFLDILGDNSIVHAMENVLLGPAGECRGLAFAFKPTAAGALADLGFDWRLYKSADTAGWSGAGTSTLVNVRLDIVPIRVAPARAHASD